MTYLGHKASALCNLIKQRAPVRPPIGHDWRTERPPNPKYIYLTTAFVSLGALLFGYDQGVMGIIIADHRWLDLMQPKNSWVIGAIISLYDVGCCLGALHVGHLADQVGRERCLSIASMFVVVGAAVQGAAYSITQMIVGRVILGYGVGAAAATVPLFLAEIAPAKLRGRSIAIQQMILCLGQAIALWSDHAFALLETDHWWRPPILMQVVPAIFLSFGCWF
jgi:MFS family permease